MNDKFEKMFKAIIIVESAATLSSVATLYRVVKVTDDQANYQKVLNYVQSLSTEELENLSYDLIEANISDSDAEIDLSMRTVHLTDTYLPTSDELKELFGKSVAKYLEEIRHTNYEEYKIILETLSDGNIDGEVFDELDRDSTVKKLKS